MKRSGLFGSLGVACAAFVAAAFTTVPSSTVPGLAYNPQHYVNNDPIWDAFNQAVITPDLKKGAYRAAFPAGQSRLAPLQVLGEAPEGEIAAALALDRNKASGRLAEVLGG